MAIKHALVLFSLLSLAQVSSAEEPFSRWKESTDRAYAVQDAAEEYVKTLKLEETRGRSALDKLLGDGFMCGFTIVRKNVPPAIFCTRSKPPIRDCVVLDLYVFLDWKGEEFNFEKLVLDLDNTSVKGIEPVCKLPFKK